MSLTYAEVQTRPQMQFWVVFSLLLVAVPGATLIHLVCQAVPPPFDARRTPARVRLFAPLGTHCETFDTLFQEARTRRLDLNLQILDACLPVDPRMALDQYMRPGEVAFVLDKHLSYPGASGE